MHESHWSCVFLRGTGFFIVTIIPIEIPDSVEKYTFLCYADSGMWLMRARKNPPYHERSQAPHLW